jgi:DNA polymerase I-like protein with 3'-5' exonuclease and polymerase domains
MLIAFDLESYYDKELNVRELGAFNYLARTDVYLASFWGPDGGWAAHPSEVDWTRFKDSELWSHNRAFDGAFLAARNLPDPGGNCTSNLSAYLCGYHSLKDAARVLLGVDISKEVRAEMKGVQWGDLSPERQQAVREYALRDAELCYRLAQFRDQWPEKEQRLSQHTIRMSSRGIFVDREYLAWCKSRAQEIADGAAKLIPWYGNLNEKGKEIAVTSPVETRAECVRQGIPAPASFDKQTAAFRNWLAKYSVEHPFVQAVRDYARATIKLKKLEAIERRIMPNGRVFYDLKYMGAPSTGRWIGKSRDQGGNDETGANMQNLDKDAWQGIDLRKLLIPKPGHIFIDCDLSAIEPRLLAWYVQDRKLLELLRQGYEIYEAQARSWNIWTDPRPLKTDPALRNRVKTFSLGCGYAMGALRFRQNIEDKLDLKLTVAEAKELIKIYRNNNPRVVRMWADLDKDIQDAFLNHTDRGLNFHLPSGRSLRYTDIRLNPKSMKTWGLDLIANANGSKIINLYGGSLTENIIQATGRDVFADTVLRLEDAGYTLVLTIHDEVLIEAPIGSDEMLVQKIRAEPVGWLPGLALGAEAKLLTYYKKS